MKTFAKSVLVDYIVKPTIAYYVVTEVAKKFDLPSLSYRTTKTPKN